MSDVEVQDCSPLQRPFKLVRHRQHRAGCRMLRGVLWCLLILFGCQPAVDAPKTAAKSKSRRTAIKVAPTLPADHADETPAATPVEPPLSPPVVSPSVVQPIYRADDERRLIDRTALEQAGLHVLTGQHVTLITDHPTETLQDLPLLVDALFPVWENYFGPLFPNRAGTPYQMTGCLMEDLTRFEAVGWLPKNRPSQHEGWFFRDEFWWNHQPSPYYTRHLLLHEATHCYMHVACPEALPPWYVEGMAEYFATHHLRHEKPIFGALPQSPEELAGWGRIGVIQAEVQAGRALTLDQVLTLKYADFSKVEAYAWAWAICHWLEHHPRFQARFHELAQVVRTGGFSRVWEANFTPDLPTLRTEWNWWIAQLQYGHDLTVAYPDLTARVAATTTPAQPVTVWARQGWQSSGVRVTAGQTYQVRAAGRAVMAETTRPWISEPPGITLRYFAGLPLGQLAGVIAPDSAAATEKTMSFSVQPLGGRTSWTAPATGILWLRINDDWSQVQDNAGEYRVEVSEAESP